jgi:hypothetical protein
MDYDEDITNFIDLFKKYSEAEISQSIKIKKGKIFDKRFLVSLPSHQISLDEIKSILEKWNFPQKHFTDISIQFYHSEFVQFAIDKEKKANYRIYFGKKNSQKQLVNLQKQNPKTTLLYGSYKWDVDGGDKFVSTNYSAIRNANSEEILKLIKETKAFTPKFIKDLIKNNDIKQQPHFLKKMHLQNAEFLTISELNNCILFLVSDVNSPRKSYNLRHPNTSIDQISKDIEKRFELKIKDIFSGYQDKKIDDFSSGLDKNQEEFVTFYFEFEPISNIKYENDSNQQP